MLTLNIIGAGKLGQTLGYLFHENYYFQILGVLNKNFSNAEKAVQHIGAGTAYSTLPELPPADIYLITTPDSEVSQTAEALAQLISNPNAIAFHCSGALPSTALSALSDKGMKIASMHPLMTFAQSETDFTHIPCAFEGDHTAFEILHAAFSVIGGIVFNIATEKKSVYHAATAVASNYLITLLDTAADLYVESGLNKEQAFSLMQPLVKKTVDNLFTLGSTKALTGPIARGDANTIQLHMNAITDRSIKNLYTLLGDKTVALSTQKGDARDESLRKIQKILSETE